MGLPNLAKIYPGWKPSQFVDNFNLKYWNTKAGNLNP